MVFHGKWYDEMKVGDSFSTSITVTETHIVLGSEMFGDFNPLHVDEEFSKKSMFGGRILHGPSPARWWRRRSAIFSLLLSGRSHVRFVSGAPDSPLEPLFYQHRT